MGDQISQYDSLQNIQNPTAAGQDLGVSDHPSHNLEGFSYNVLYRLHTLASVFQLCVRLDWDIKPQYKCG